MLVGCSTVPETGRKQFNFLTPDQEMEMGLTSFNQMKEEVPISKDAASAAMVERVGKRIAAVAPLAQCAMGIRAVREQGSQCLLSARRQGGRLHRHFALHPGRGRVGHRDRTRSRPCRCSARWRAGQPANGIGGGGRGASAPRCRIPNGRLRSRDRATAWAARSATRCRTVACRNPKRTRWACSTWPGPDTIRRPPSHSGNGSLNLNNREAARPVFAHPPR